MNHEQKQKKTGWLWMLLCCLAPVLVVAALALSGWNYGTVIYTIVLLICPLSMGAMMLFGRRSHCFPKDKTEPENR